MDDDKGTDTTDAKEGCSGWFMLEAACSDDSDLDNSLEKLFEDGTESDVSDLINDDDTAAQEIPANCYVNSKVRNVSSRFNT